MRRWLLLLSLGLVACRPTPTFRDDVAPILDAHCTQCHAPGGIGPFSLLSYADAKARAFDIADEAEEGDMPPFHADNSGDCNTFKDAQTLSNKEIQTLVDWANGGAPEGGASAPLTPPEPEVLPNPELVLTLPEPYLSQKLDENGELSADDIRCFVLETGLAGDLFLSAYEMLPEHPEIAHHMLLFRLEDAAAEAEAVAKDAAFELDAFGNLQLDENGQPFNNPGYDCPGDSGIRAGRSSTIAAWAPGRNVREYPAGTGIRLKAGQKLILQMHYNYGTEAVASASAAGPVQPYHGSGLRLTDQSSLAFRLVPSVEDEASVARFGPLSFSIPTGQDSFTVENLTPPAPAGTPRILLHAMLPHMHQRAESLQVDIGRPGGEEECALRIPDWDYHWQDLYMYETALEVGEGDSFRLRCEYQTRGDLGQDFDEGSVVFGEQTEDEMCFNFFYMTCPDLPGGCPADVVRAIESVN